MKSKRGHEEVVSWNAMLSNFEWDHYKTWNQRAWKENQIEIWLRVKVKRSSNQSLNSHHAIGV